MTHLPRKTVWEYHTEDHGILRISARRLHNWDTCKDEWKFNAVTRHGSLLGLPTIIDSWGRVLQLRDAAVEQFTIIG